MRPTSYIPLSRRVMLFVLQNLMPPVAAVVKQLNVKKAEEGMIRAVRKARLGATVTPPRKQGRRMSTFT